MKTAPGIRCRARRITATPTHSPAASAPPVSFTAKSLAVQMTALDSTIGSTTQTYPEDTVKYTVKFEVSDYFTLNDLTVQTQLSDGLANPSYAPQLTLTPRLNPSTPPSGLAASTSSDLGVIIRLQS